MCLIKLLKSVTRKHKSFIKSINSTNMQVVLVSQQPQPGFSNMRQFYGTPTPLKAVVHI